MMAAIGLPGVIAFLIELSKTLFKIEVPNLGKTKDQCLCETTVSLSHLQFTRTKMCWNKKFPFNSASKYVFMTSRTLKNA